MAETRGKWTLDGLYILGGSVVGTVSKAANDLYYAHGCLDDWEDTSLGCYETGGQAKKAVQSWVKEHANG